MDTDLPTLSPEPIAPEFPSKAKLATKIVANIAAGAVSSVVVSAIHQNTTTYNNSQKFKLYVGAYVLGAMVADKAADYVEVKVTPFFNALEDFLWIPVEPESDYWTPVTETDPVDSTEQ